VAVHHGGFKAEVGAGHATRLCSRKKDLTAKSRYQACNYEIRRKCDKNRVSLTSVLRCDTQDHLPQKEKPQVTEDAQASNTPVPLPDCAAWHHGFNFSGHFGFKRDLTREAKFETSPDMT